MLDGSGNPISLARVQFIFDGAPEPRFTDDSGYVSISIPKREEIKVLIHKEGFKTIRREINLSADKDTTVEYVMDLDPNTLNDPEKTKEDNGFSQETHGDTGEDQGSASVSEKNSLLERVNPSQPDIMEPLDFFDLYFYRIDNGLYEEAFQMLSQNYLAEIYFSRGYSSQSALADFKRFWDRCDMEYKDKSVALNGEEAIIFYHRRYFCRDDHAVGREDNFQSQKMVLIKSSDGQEWKINQVVANQ